MIEVEHFSYPYVNLCIYYAFIKSDQAKGPELQDAFFEYLTKIKINLPAFYQPIFQECLQWVGQRKQM